MFQEVLILLAASVVAVTAFRRLHMPPVLGYLSVGILVGPSVAGLIGDVEEVSHLAEFGVVFLLFTIGLEFSLPQLRAMRWTVLGLGGAQVILGTGLIASGAWYLGVSPGAALVIGGALALSSTAVVIKQLTEQVEIHSRHGRRAVGVLLFQDLAVVPLLIVIPLLGNNGGEGIALAMGWALVKGIAVFALMLALGHWALRPLFHEVARARSNELFTMTVLLVALVAAWGTHLAGLSLALGGFLAGIMLGETEYRHQIEADIRPFRDVLLGLFFVTIGMLLDLGVLAEHWLGVLTTVAAFMLFKLGLVYGLARLGGNEARVAVRTAVILAGGGEFGFALLSLALSNNVLASVPSQIALAAVILSMAITPLLVRYNEVIAQALTGSGPSPHGRQTGERVAEQAASLRDHVLIGGYGRTGQNVARFLEEEGIPYLALDLDPARVREAQAAGERVHFGDSARQEILEAAGVSRARMVVLTYNDPQATLNVLSHVRRGYPELPVVVRTRDDVWLERFHSAGATAIVPEVLEASLMLATHALTLLGIPLGRIFRYVRDVRANRYRMLRGYFHGQERVDLEKADRFREQLHAVTLPEQAHAVGRRLAELRLDEAGIDVTAVRRGGIRGPQPEPHTRLRSGDVVVLYGTPENLEHAERLLLGGGR
ncbi:monovalent cation:proton antiporter-2 (CPA2) family protein [Arhodomonas sp. SL1]|uniref:monovalent cation:proton antiporter-2 (CPA2) family protein n=1 Tax=Arhodomonas sp. SL1 TaxID=3425691 RepID=UPI003F883661